MDCSVSDVNMVGWFTGVYLDSLHGIYLVLLWRMVIEHFREDAYLGNFVVHILA